MKRERWIGAAVASLGLLAALALGGVVLANSPAIPYTAPGATAPAPAVLPATAFTYQGEVKENGLAADGSYTMTFRLWNASSGGSPASETLTKTVDVSVGLFSVQLDFGAAPFTGQRLWLEINVNGVPLVQRQEITPAPYAIAAQNGVPTGYMIAGTSPAPPAGYTHGGLRLYAADTNLWGSRSPMPTARFSLAAAELGGKVYALGGIVSPPPVSNLVEVFDPATNSWSSVATMPTSRSSLAAAAVNGKVYAIGGTDVLPQTYFATVEAYEPGGNLWTPRASMAVTRSNLAAVTFNGKIYAIGGYNGSAGVLNVVEEYDPVANTWATKAPMPTARSGLCAGAVGNRIYAIGSTVDIYDPVADTWSTAANPVPFARSNSACAAASGRIYVIGGTFNSNAVSTVDEYDPATDTWALRASMPVERTRLAAATVNGRVYAVGGMLAAGGGSAASTYVHEYTPAIVFYLHQKQ